ncbi:hypothetical protein LCGC14_0952280 [marine sediment metagenome]|uniref:HTH gntR-type domain-containing protein n=1 Tax=marine sediment metagenome TaxID=412755 RepID=A0A0F9P331_9ZZZZ
MAIWQARMVETSRVKYIGIVEAIEEDIKRRVLKPGDRLPSQRLIANELMVDLTTVTRAINEAARRGLVETQRGSGSFIAQTTFNQYNSLQLTQGKTLDLSMNNPPIPVGINIEQKIADSIIKSGNASHQPNRHLFYQETAGHPDDRAAGSEWLSEKIPQLDQDKVLISSGAHSALFSILNHLHQQGATHIAAPEFSYPGLRAMADQLSLVLTGIDMDEDGIKLDCLENKCREQSIDALYLIPNIDNPTTATLPLARRQAIADLAEKYNFILIEDDPYYPLLEQKITSLYSLAPERCWHIATVSKCLSPSMRVAYIVAPDLQHALRLTDDLRISHLMAPPLMTAVVSDWIDTGMIDSVSQEVKKENQRRQRIAKDIFVDHTLFSDDSASHIWMPLRKGFRALDLSEQANSLGISIVPSTAFVMSTSQRQAVRISLGAEPDINTLHTGLSMLADLFQPGKLRSKSIV